MTDADVISLRHAVSWPACPDWHRRDVRRADDVESRRLFGAMPPVPLIDLDTDSAVRVRQSSRRRKLAVIPELGAGGMFEHATQFLHLLDCPRRKLLFARPCAGHTWSQSRPCPARRMRDHRQISEIVSRVSCSVPAVQPESFVDRIRPHKQSRTRRCMERR